MAEVNLARVELPPGMLPEKGGDEPPVEFEPTELALADALVSAIKQASGVVIHTGDGFRCWKGDCFEKDVKAGPVQEMAKAKVRCAGSGWKPADRSRI